MNIICSLINMCIGLLDNNLFSINVGIYNLLTAIILSFFVEKKDL